MPRFRNVLVTLVVLLCVLSLSLSLRAQDTRSVSEPTFPRVCAVLHASLQSTPEGPSVGPTIEEQNAESSAETQLINDAIGDCQSGAIELALGSSLQQNAFLLNPVIFPPGVSLIIDGGVTVYASRAPANYQLSNTGNYACGTVAGDLVTGVCQALLTFDGDPHTGQANSGLYGYGIIDGQGQMPMLFTGVVPTPVTWWGLRLQKHNSDGNVNENSPIMVAAGDTPDIPADNFTMYKVTIRNPPFHTVRLGGDGVTVWGVRIQAPWNEPNTDGFDLHGSNITLYDTSVANGDDDIAIAVAQTDTKNITVRHFSAYARDGLTLLGNGNGKYSMSNLLFDDILITGDLPSVVTTTVNGVTTGTVNGVSETTLQNTYNVTGYAQALPNAQGDVHGINLKYQSGSSMTNVIYRNVCMQDIRTPLYIGPQETPSTTPTIGSVTFQNIHVLAPSPQYLNYNYANGASGAPGSGRYQINFEGISGTFYPQFTLANVVFDDVSKQNPSIAGIYAIGNEIATKKNVYPAVFNDLASPPVDKPLPTPWNNTSLDLTLSDNSYTTPGTPISSPWLANPCNRAVPYITGDLFASNGNALATGDATNLTTFSTTAGSSISLNAVVQPIMSQTTLAIPGKTAAQNIVAIASPALTHSVRFYDGFRYVGSAVLSANGTLASIQIKNLSPGWHFFSAQYSKDQFYSTLNFGLVTVYVSPRRP